MKTSDEWLAIMLAKYDKNPSHTVEQLLQSAVDVMQQYVESPSNASLEVLKSCLEHNKMFLELIQND